ncbi:putative Myb/SANT-like domain-containing protein [Arabidopsis thaliana]
MEYNRRRNTNPSRGTVSTHPTEILTPPTETTIRLDEFKKSYKKWKALTHKTGITVDPDTSFINASDAWWTEQEFGCKLTKNLNRKPSVFWDVMQRCLVLHDVQSQSQHSACQRREQLIHEHGVDEEGEDYSDSDSGNMPQTEVPETQEEEEVRQQRGRPNFQSTARRGSSAQRSGGTSRVSIGSGSGGSRRRQSFETTIQDSITSFGEFQQQSFQQLRPGAFDQDDYDEFKKAEAIFIALDLPKHTRFHWACINALKELVFWPKYFIDIAASPDKDKNTTKRCTVGNTTKRCTVRNTIKCSTLGNTTKCTVGHATKCSTMGNITKCSTIAANRKFSTRWFKRNDSNKCSIWIFSWMSRRWCNN